MTPRLEAVRDRLLVLGIEHDCSPEHVIARCDHATLARVLVEAGVVVDVVCIDAPFSTRTHEGHDDGTAAANRVLSWAKGREKRGQQKMTRGVTVKMRVDRVLADGAVRREIDFPPWTGADVDAFVGAWSPLCGWLLSLTDHVLAREWERSLGEAYRYVFAPIACIEHGSRVRLDGTGPPQWGTQLVPSRPRSREFLDAWNAKRWEHGLAPQGGYSGGTEKKKVAGGKPRWLMRQIVGDYAAPGDIVCDSTAGGGTTLVAAIEIGRFALGCEPDAERYEIAVADCRAARRPLPALVTRPQLRETLALDLTEQR